METTEVKLPSHLSNIYKKMVLEGLIVDKKYVGEIPLGEYLKSAESLDSTEEKPPTTNAQEPIPDINKMIADAVAKALANQPTATPQPVQQVFTSKKDYDIDDDIPEIANWELKAREYRLMNGKRPITHSIRRAHSAQMAMQYFNKRTGKTHTMRWSPNQTSFFIENQSTNASDILDEEIVFGFGTLNVPENNPNLQKFLHIHPLKGILFDEYNANDESKKAVTSKKIKAKAYSLVESVGKTMNRAVCALVSPSYIEDWGYDQVEEAIYNYVETNPQDYINYCEDPSTKVKGIVKSSIAKGELIWKDYRFYDKQRNIVLEVDRNKDEISEIANYFGTSEGRKLFEYLSNLS